MTTAAAASPLSHHDILALVEPFTRRGRHVDLAASDRASRHLVFKAPATAPDSPDALREQLQLDGLSAQRWRLTRTLTGPDGLQATLSAHGTDVAALLAHVEAVPAARHFSAGRGHAVARSYTLDRVAPGSPAGASPLLLTQGRVVLDGLVLTLDLPAVARVAASLTLRPMAAGAAGAAPVRPALPEDLLAVLGWNWTRLVPDRHGWTSRLRLRGRPQARTAAAEAALLQAAAHLARTLSEPPAQFHDRLRAARWAAFARRGIPTGTALALFGAVGLCWLFVPDMPLPVMVALYHVPTVLVAVSFTLQELPRFEIPPWPRRLERPTWGRPPDAVAA